MRNGGQAQQTAVMAPPHLNGSAQFVSGDYAGYAPRQSWGQHFQGAQHPRNAARPLSHPPPPPSRRGDSQRSSGNGSSIPKSAPLLHSSKPGTHRSTTPSVSWGQHVLSNVWETSFFERFLSFSLSYFLSLLSVFARVREIYVSLIRD